MFNNQQTINLENCVAHSLKGSSKTLARTSFIETITTQSI